MSEESQIRCDSCGDEGASHLAVSAGVAVPLCDGCFRTTSTEREREELEAALDEARRERDELRAEVDRLRSEVTSLRGEMIAARAEEEAAVEAADLLTRTGQPLRAEVERLKCEVDHWKSAAREYALNLAEARERFQGWDPPSEEDVTVGDLVGLRRVDNDGEKG